ncbi:MAG: hypothetical protein WC939_01620 [Acholeplasmataceae bacterium]
MQTFISNIKSFLTLIVVIIITVAQSLAPALTLILLIISVIKPTVFTMTVFFVSAILYFVGFYTTRLGVKLETPNHSKSDLDVHHPFLGTLFEFLWVFLPSAIIALIISAVSSDFTYFLHILIISNWIYRLIKFFISTNKTTNEVAQHNETQDDNEIIPLDNLLERFKKASSYEEYSEIHHLAQKNYTLTKDTKYKQVCRISHIGSLIINNSFDLSEDDLVKRREEINLILSDLTASLSEPDLIKEDLNETKVVEGLSEENLNVDEFLETKKRDIIFSSEIMAATFNLLKNDKKLPINSAIFGTAVINEHTWIEADLTNIGEVMLDVVDATSGKCMVGDYEIKHSPDVDFDDYGNLLVNLVMSVVCVNININKPQLEGKKIVDFVIQQKELINKHVKSALNGIFTLDNSWITMNELNFQNIYPKYKDLIKRAMRQ